MITAPRLLQIKWANAPAHRTLNNLMVKNTLKAISHEVFWVSKLSLNGIHLVVSPKKIQDSCCYWSTVQKYVICLLLLIPWPYAILAQSFSFLWQFSYPYYFAHKLVYLVVHSLVAFTLFSLTRCWNWLFGSVQIC